jgi:hypothetical protein
LRFIQKFLEKLLYLHFFKKIQSIKMHYTLNNIPREDRTYLFREVVDDSRRIAGFQDDPLEGLRTARSRNLPEIHEVKFILGGLYRDSKKGEGYKVFTLRDGQDFEDNSFNGIKRIRTKEEAIYVAAEALTKLRDSGYLLDDPDHTLHRGEIINLEEHGFEIQLTAVVDAKKSDLPKLERLLLNIPVRL